jgi:large subunit ribosomal protein L22
MAKTENNVKNENIAKASSLNLAISTKDSVEISNFLRYKPLSFAKAYLEEVVELKKAIPLKRFIRDVGHKKGMSSGRYPVKAAKQFLVLLNSVEANAQFKGLNTSGLKITKLISNKASIPSTGGRSRTGTKRTSLEIEVKEASDKKKDKNAKKGVKTETSKTEAKVEEKIEEQSNEVTSSSAKPAEPKVEEPKAEELKTEDKEETIAKDVQEETTENNNQNESEKMKEEITKNDAVGEKKE